MQAWVSIPHRITDLVVVIVKVVMVKQVMVESHLVSGCFSLSSSMSCGRTMVKQVLGWATTPNLSRPSSGTVAPRPLQGIV